MSLEVDQRGSDLPMLDQAEKESYRTEEREHRVHVYPTHDNASTPPPSSKEQSRRKGMPLMLAIALAVMTVLAIVAAAIGGSTAAKRKNDINVLNTQLSTTHLALDQCILDKNNNSSSNYSTASDSSASNTSTTLPNPTSNCTAMGSQYISAWTHASFAIHCETDYPGSDLLGIWMFKFADCIEACASWNYRQNTPLCFAVSYETSGTFTEEGGQGNCFLKGSGNVQAYSRNATSSASANLSGSSSKG